MKTVMKLLVAGVALVMVTGCSINHPVAKDYPAFLEKNANTVVLPETTIDADYLVEKTTQDHRYEFRAATVGYAHLWIVEFGKILDETLNAPYVQQSFTRLDKQLNSKSSNGHLIQFTLENYEFKNYRAYVSLKVDVMINQQLSSSQVYSAEGVSKGGKMWLAGPFGMKNATLESTKSALDKILIEFIKNIQ
ncbi:hypothetical protein WN093_15330 [Gammaproteobacteria bacterium AS21]